MDFFTYLLRHYVIMVCHNVCEDEFWFNGNFINCDSCADTAYESGLLDGFDDGATSGDLNLDGFHNVSDIVLAVELILTGE